MSRSPVRFALVLGLLMGALTWAAIPAQAASVSGCYSDQTQLQSAIASAGTGGTVQFSCDATIPLTSTIALNQSVTIDGNGHTVVLDGQDQRRVIQVASGAQVTLTGLTITRGTADGGGIYNAGTLLLANSTVSASRGFIAGGGISNEAGASLTVTDSTITGNSLPYTRPNNWGGGIFTRGTVTIIDSVITGNTGPVGGAIGIASGSGAVTIINSTISSNIANDGGGIYNGGALSVSLTGSAIDGNSAVRGGGIMSLYTIVAVSTSTFTGNSAQQGGGIFNFGPLTVADSTFTGNAASTSGASLYNSATATFSGSSLTIPVTRGHCAGTKPVDGGGNSADDTTCGFAAADTTAPVIGYTLTPAAPSGSNGWYTENVSLTWSVVEAESTASLATIGCDNQTITSDQLPTMYSCAATSDGGSAVQVDVTLKRDATPPAVSVTGISDGAVYTLGDVIPAPGCSTTDATSGVATEATLVSNGGPVGPITLTCAGAVDNAGNTADPASITYSVVYAWSGFLSPVDNLPAINAVKAGAGVPVKFALGGDQGLGAVTAITSVGIACDSSAVISDVETTVAAGSSSLQYDPTTGKYTYVWKTAKSWSGTCRQLTLTLADGTSHTANFIFR